MPGADSGERARTVSLVVLAAVAVMGAMVFLRAVLVPLAFAMFFYSVISPVIASLEDRLRVRRSVSIAIGVLLFLAGAGLMALLAAMSISRFAEGAGIYQERMAMFMGNATELLKRYDIDVSGQDIPHSIPLANLTRGVTGWAAGFIGNALLVVIFALFMIVGRRAGQDTHPALAAIERRIATYAWVKLTASVLTGACAAVILWSFDVELTTMLALLTVFLNFIPSVGAVVATLLPLPVLLLQFGLGWQVILVTALLTSVQVVFGSLLEPRLMGRSLDLHPTTVLLALVFWGVIWGVPGMFLSVPLTAAIKTLLERSEGGRPVAELLAGRINAAGDEGRP